MDHFERPSNADDVRVYSLRGDQRDLLQALRELHGEDDMRFPSTVEVCRRLLEIVREHPPYGWSAQPPWHGTAPMARELEDMGLITVDVGVAKYRHPDQPIPTVDEFYLGLTHQGRRVATRPPPA